MKTKLTIAVILLLAGCSEKIAQAPIATTTPVVVASPAPSPTPTPAAMSNEFPDLLAQIKQLHKAGQELRSKSNCTQEMQKLQSQAKAIRAKAEAAAPDSPIRIYLAPAAIDLNLCVSCSDATAPTACQNVASAIKDAEGYLN
ncbi:hypothetical protein [Nostoc flagelliforme]|nr:hypothetical protein [Nostoc flagelliforme]